MAKILAIDDKKDNLTSVSALLKNFIPGCRVITAQSGAEGLSKARAVSPDTILLDVKMPQMDGFEVCKHLKSAESTKHIPVIMLTAIKTDAESRIKGLELGADAFLTKPIDGPELAAQVNVMLRIKQTEDLLRNEKDLLKTVVDEKTKALRESEERFRLLFERAPLSYQSLDERGHLIEVNQAWLDTLGYSREEVLGKSFGALLHPDWSDHFKENFPRFKAVGETLGTEFEMVKKDGSLILVSFNGKIGRNENGEFKQTHCIMHDITEKRRSEKELRESEQRYRSLFEQSNDAIIIHDLDGHIFDINQRASEMLGYEKERLLNMPVSKLHPEEELAVSDKAFQETRDKGHVRFESRLKKADGNLVDVEISARVTDPDKNIVQGFIRDISERKRTEMLEAQIMQAQKMEAIGTLAGGIAHDFNNILFSIIGNTELVLCHELPEAHPARRTLEQVLKACHRAADLVRQILTFSRKKEHQLMPASITPVVKEAVKLLRPSLPTTIDIQQQLAAESDTVLVDPSQIHQVLMNLCTNAAHAMHSNGGVLTIGLRDVAPGSPQLVPYPHLISKSCLELVVSDTGHGIDPAVMDRIFEPYFTTKSLEEGTGLGLAVVHGIIKSFGGEIRVESEAGTGSTFTIFLPKIGDPAAAESIRHEPLQGGDETILFVDDEKSVVKMAKQMLERLGYSVTVRTNSRHALEDFRRQPHNFDLVITDMTMPNLTGDKLAEELLSIRPDIPIILCTGYSDLITQTQAETMGIREFVMKPLNRHQLADTIRSVLDR